MPDPLPGTNGFEVVANNQVYSGDHPDVRAKLQASLQPDEVARQENAIELLRSQPQLESMQVSPDRLISHLQALQQIGQYDARALGQSKMLQTANGEEVVEPRHREDPSLVGQSTQLDQDKCLVEHFEYVSRLVINWKWPKHQEIWNTAKSIVDRMRQELQAAHEQWRQDRVNHNEAGPDVTDISGKSGALHQQRKDIILSKYAGEIRTIIDAVIPALQASETPQRVTSD